MGRIISIFLAIAVFMTLTFPLRASGGELDGKSIQCSFRANWGEGIWLGDSWGVSFENGKAVTLFVDDTYPPKIKRTTISEYVVDEDKIMWVMKWNVIGYRFYFLDRKNLKISYRSKDDMDLRFPATEIEHAKCALRSVEKMQNGLGKIVDELRNKSEQKKQGNKL